MISTPATRTGTARRTKTQRLADRHVQGGIDAYVLDRRNAEQQQSWDSIARDLLEATGGVVDVTGATLRNWYGERVSA